MSGTATTTTPAPVSPAAGISPAAALPKSATKIYSPSRNLFYAPELQATYVAAGSWPADGVSVPNATWSTYTATPPSGQVRANVGGFPGWVAAPVPPPPTPSQASAALVAAGLTVSCATAPGIAGTYAATPQMIANVQSEILSILVSGTFTSGSATLQWPDASGALHTFPDVALFKAFAVAMAAFVGSAAQFGMGAAGATLPSASVVIADPSATATTVGATS